MKESTWIFIYEASEHASARQSYMLYLHESPMSGVPTFHASACDLILTAYPAPPSPKRAWRVGFELAIVHCIPRSGGSRRCGTPETSGTALHAVRPRSRLHLARRGLSHDIWRFMAPYTHHHPG